MEVCMDHPEKNGIHAMKNLHGIHVWKKSMYHGIIYNSAIFWSRDSVFRIEVCMNYLKKWASIKNVLGIYARQIPWTMKLALTRWLSQLETWDFAKKFDWTIQKKWHLCNEKSAWNLWMKNSTDHSISYDSAIFELKTQDFAWKFIWTI